MRPRMMTLKITVCSCAHIQILVRQEVCETCGAGLSTKRKLTNCFFSSVVCVMMFASNASCVHQSSLSVFGADLAPLRWIYCGKEIEMQSPALPVLRTPHRQTVSRWSDSPKRMETNTVFWKTNAAQTTDLSEKDFSCRNASSHIASFFQVRQCNEI